ncbi:hypothetical protein BDV26DRAFT_22947 [Aspergillus bertholletiae]|uniref:Uncharacterized protein n=1 Tax=Aspergillus bertholletiae TaxID=1226010 RepID=A0A5N7AZ59_9EURO|nr:hypothetical protein BDV26DRAFT_22947 [Aspergillus bertholletiae]
MADVFGLTEGKRRVSDASDRGQAMKRSFLVYLPCTGPNKRKEASRNTMPPEL